MKTCKFYETCELFCVDSKTCKETAGMYYDDRPAGCYRYNEMKEGRK